MSLDWLLRDQLLATIDAGYEVIGVSAPGPHVERLAEIGVRHMAVDSLTRSMALRRDIAAARDLYRLFRRLRPTIVHTHNPKPGVIGRIAARIARVPIVVNTQHGLYAQTTDPLRQRLPVYVLERLAAGFSHHEFVQSRDDVATLRSLRVPNRRITDLGNGVNLDRFDSASLPPTTRRDVRAEWGVGADDVVALVVGRLVAEKGIAELTQAARVLGDRITIVVVGPNDPGKADELSSDDITAAEVAGLRFVGRRDDMPRCYAAADLFVTATYREGFPRSAMEASAMGLPVVATDIRGCRQVVDHLTTGELVPPRDAPALAAAIERLAADERYRTALGRAAAAKAAAEFDVRRVSATILAEYERQLQRVTATRR